MSKKTLYITFDGLTDPLGQSQILPYLIGIAKQGYSITILSCEKKERLEKGKSLVLDLILNTSISWQYIIYDEEGGALSRFLYLKKLNVLAKKFHKKNQFKLVHCRSYLSSIIGLNFKVKYKIPFIFDMRGFWADERIDGGIWKKHKFLHRLFYNYFKEKEKQFLINSNAIVSLTRNAVGELKRTNPKIDIAQKTTVIPCCCNTQLFNRDNIQENIKLNGISDGDVVLVYTGSIGTWYYTKEMIDCILIWKKFEAKLKLLIVTKDTASLNDILTNYPSNITETIIIASASYKEIPNYLSLAQAAIFFIKPSYSKIASSPTKMAECWAMNLPIITNSGIGDNDIFFKNNLGGIVIDNFSNEEYEMAYRKYVELKNHQNNYRNIALTYFDVKEGVSKYTSIYSNLIS